MICYNYNALRKDINLMRENTRQVKVGNIILGGQNHVYIQSMCNIKTSKVKQVVKQILELEELGCEIIRVSIFDEKDAYSIKRIKEQIHIPLVADIHFNPHLALLAIENGADKIRLNPGNITDEEDIKKIIELAKEKGIAIRIGVNSGSAANDKVGSDFKVDASYMVNKLDEYIKIFEKYDFHNLVLALKSSSPLQTIEAYTLASKKYNYPLHIGITEASVKDVGLIRSSVGLAPLLLNGIGDTIRISLSDDPKEEIIGAKRLLHDCGLYPNYYTIISCPTCGRTQANTKSISNKVMKLLEKYKKNIVVAVMGCVVNGIGEGKQADIGIACGGNKKYIIFKQGKIVRRSDLSSLLQDFEEELQKI